jgi:hypothetical protein
MDALFFGVQVKKIYALLQSGDSNNDATEQMHETV